MSPEVKTQQAAEEKKSKTLVELLSAAFAKTVVVDLRGVKLTLTQPPKKKIFEIQLETLRKLGDARKFVSNPEKMKELSDEEKEDILDKTQEIRDLQTVKLIRLCCISEELDEVDDEFLQMMVFQTGGDSAPISIAAKKLTGTYDNDFIQDDPFFRRTSI